MGSIIPIFLNFLELQPSRMESEEVWTFPGFSDNMFSSTFADMNG